MRAPRLVDRTARLAARLGVATDEGGEPDGSRASV
jgi:hypothetical protein